MGGPRGWVPGSVKGENKASEFHSCCLNVRPQGSVIRQEPRTPQDGRWGTGVIPLSFHTELAFSWKNRSLRQTLSSHRGKASPQIPLVTRDALHGLGSAPRASPNDYAARRAGLSWTPGACSNHCNLLLDSESLEAWSRSLWLSDSLQSCWVLLCCFSRAQTLPQHRP